MPPGVKSAGLKLPCSLNPKLRRPVNLHRGIEVSGILKRKSPPPPFDQISLPVEDLVSFVIRIAADVQFSVPGSGSEPVAPLLIHKRTRLKKTQEESRPQNHRQEARNHRLHRTKPERIRFLRKAPQRKGGFLFVRPAGKISARASRTATDGRLHTRHPTHPRRRTQTSH